MFRRWATYVRLGLLDLVRLWPTTQHHVIIVAGICLPILLLLGLKRGHVAQLREALVKSPTGRQVVFGSSRSGELLTRDSIRRLERELPGVEVIIPDVYRLVNIQAKGRAGVVRTAAEVTCFATSQVDPYLSHLGATLPKANAASVILSKAVAEALQVQPGDSVQVLVRRQVGINDESASVTFNVLSVIETDNPDAQIAYVDTGVHDRFSLYGQGAGVPEYGWPAGGSSAVPRYRSYLAFCERSGRSFSPRDLRDLEYNYKVQEITGKLPEALTRLLLPEKLKELRIYELRSRRGKRELEDPRSADIYDPEATDADEIVLPWNEPLTGEVAGQQWTLVGLSSARLRWLRTYLLPEAILTGTGDDPLRLRVIESANPVKEKSLAWPLTGGGQIPLTVLSGDAKEGPTTLAVVPARVLAWLHAQASGEVVYDPGSRLFKQPPRPPRYNRARLYAHTIDDVPAVVDALWERHFSIQAEQARIREIHEQDSSLQLLVIVVGAGVFLFGVITVVSVLIDSTDRKRGTIGILRVMGTSQSGVFLLIFIRAVVIGLLATLLCAGLGWLLALGLSWQPPASWNWLASKPVVAVVLLPGDFLLVLIGAVLCCAAGALWPAWRASRLDPFEAIVEGRFR